MSVRSHQMDIYGVWMHIATNKRDWATLRRRDKRVPPVDGLGHTVALSNPDGFHLCLYIDAQVVEGNPQGLTELLAHEATHAGCMLLDHIGQEYDGESESLAYLVAYIAAWCWEACNP